MLTVYCFKSQNYKHGTGVSEKQIWVNAEGRARLMKSSKLWNLLCDSQVSSAEVAKNILKGILLLHMWVKLDQIITAPLNFIFQGSKQNT